MFLFAKNSYLCKPLQMIHMVLWHFGFQVTTKDGYILSMQRIPLGRSEGKGGSRVPVVLQHGVLMVSNFETGR